MLLPRSGRNHLLPCLFDQMHRSTPDLPVAHTIRELALCRDDNSKFLLTSVEMSQIIKYYIRTMWLFGSALLIYIVVG